MMLRSFMNIQSTKLAISIRDNEIGVSSRLPHGCPLGDTHRRVHRLATDGST